jgi:hypothetical protein
MANAKRQISTYTTYVAGPPEKTFPLLCPEQECDWIEGWPEKRKHIYTDSGFAELDCIFTATVFDRLGPETWCCSRYEPSKAIDYLRMSPHTVIRLELRLEPAGPGTHITAKLVFSALDKKGEEFLETCHHDTCEQHFKPCFIMLDHFLRTGKMLPMAEALARAG